MAPDDPRVGAALEEYLAALEAGQRPDREAFLARHPDIAPALRGCLDGLEFVGDVAPQLSGGDPGPEAAYGTLPFTPASGPPPEGEAALPQVPGYEILDVIDRGGMGVVYKARHLALNRVVALKMILAGRHAGAEQEARFQAEARAVARFQHPNIVQVHDIGEHGGLPYFSLEFVEGGSLARRIKEQRPSDKEAAQLVAVLARATHRAHERGIVHRDLKPANVLLTKDGTPKIADFGLAKFLGADGGQTASGAIVGTASYMAPEQAAGIGKDVGPAADVYALGAILYELLTGRPPFRAETQLETLRQVQQEPPQWPHLHNSNVDPPLEAICLMCLRKAPADRYPSAEALAADLEAYLRGDSIRAYRGSARRLVRTVLRESPYTEVMSRWGRVWMGVAVWYFAVCLSKSFLLWHDVTRHEPFLALWVVGFVVLAGMVWFGRVRRGPPFSHVERQLGQVWVFFWAGFFLTAWLYWRAGGPVEGLLPILVLEAGLAYGSMAAVLGGSFYVMAAACVATAVLEALLPQAGPLISAAFCSPALFWLGRKYS